MLVPSRLPATNPIRGILAVCCALTTETVSRTAVVSRQTKILLIIALTTVFAANCFLLTAYFHLITLSAWYKTDCGIVRPICFAVFKLITNSNLVSCSTGSSAGLAPFRILSTYTAARRSRHILGPAHYFSPEKDFGASGTKPD